MRCSTSSARGEWPRSTSRARTPSSGAARLCVVKQILPEFATQPAVHRHARPRGEARGAPEPRERRAGVRPRARRRPALHRDGVRRGLRPERAPPPLLAEEDPAPLRVRAPASSPTRCAASTTRTAARTTKGSRSASCTATCRRRTCSCRSRGRSRSATSASPARTTPSSARGADIGEAIKGKAGYMSPEHARGEPIDARADVFAAGIVLWELLAGRRMYTERERRTAPRAGEARRDPGAAHEGAAARGEAARGRDEGARGEAATSATRAPARCCATWRPT